MSVLVKNMKMPETCWECASVELNVGVTMFDGICPFCMEIIKDHDMKTGRHPDCPLVEVKDDD